MKRDKVDILFSRYIKLLSGGYCKRCNNYLGVKSRGLHTAHWRGRGRYTTRFERDNCQALCYGCHSLLDTHPDKKDDFFYEILGTKRAQEIIIMSEKTLKDFGITKELLKAKIDITIINESPVTWKDSLKMKEILGTLK